MTDTPTYRLPVDSQEQPILDSIEHIRDELSLLKSDRSTYIRSEDIIGYYDQLIHQVQLLNDIRERDGKPLEQNRGESDTGRARARADRNQWTRS